MPQNLALCTARLLIPQQEALEETSKTADELREQILAAQQSATADASKVAEAHALELQRLQVERTKLEVRLTQDKALCPAHLRSLSFNRQPPARPSTRPCLCHQSPLTSASKRMHVAR